MTDKHILQQQIAYYRARAPEYDEWFYRKGRYDRGEALNQQWLDEAAAIMQALHAMPPVGHALELASGTGIWTRELLKVAQQITAVDASLEMIKLNQAKLQSDKVRYLQADLFTWEPEQTYDMVFFSFWLSHVPPERLDSFLDKVRRAMKPGGRLFIADSRKIHESTAVDHVLPESSLVLTRKLNDGREFDIVKVFYEPENLQNQLNAAGFDVKVHTTPAFFIYVTGTKKAET